jgi:hypothetical protein
MAQRPNHTALTRRTALLALLGAPLAAMAQTAAVPVEVAAELPGASALGNGRLTFLGLHIYDVRLWVVAEFKAETFEQAPLALELEYGRTLYGKLIAERSLKEMQRVDPVGDTQGARWLAEMTKLFPDVAKGDRITGVQRPGTATRFFHNGTLRGEVSDAEFTRRFFGIWLSPKTSEPALRQALLTPPPSATRAGP